MEWLEKIVATLVEDETKRAEVVTQIKKELGLQFVPKSTFNETNNELKATKDQLASTETTIKELTNKAATAEEKEALIKKMETDHATFKADTEKRMANDKKLSALQLKLAAEVAPDAVDLVAGLITLDNVTFVDGKITNYDEIVKPVRESRASLFKTETVDTGKPGDKKTSDPGATVSDAEYYASLKLPKLT